MSRSLATLTLVCAFLQVGAHAATDGVQTPAQSINAVIDQFIFDVTSESLGGVTRHFARFSAAAKEAGLSRIYAGQHFRTDHRAGKSLGRQVAESIDANILLREE
jgi:hypothetical protein